MHIRRDQTRGVRRPIGARWFLGLTVSIPVVVVLMGVLGPWHSGQAAEFTCAGGDVTCLIAAINAANANGEANTITLAVGTYTLTAVDNETAGPNGLPSITSTMTIQGAGAETTIIERAVSAPAFRLLYIGPDGGLTLEGLTLTGGRHSLTVAAASSPMVT